MAHTPRPTAALALALLALLLWWLLSPAVVAVDLGPVQALIGRPGVESLLTRRGDGWFLTHVPADGPPGFQALEAAPGEPPQLAGDGAAWWLAAGGLVRQPPGRPAEEPRPLPGAELGRDWQLAGLDGADQPVLLGRDAQGPCVALPSPDGSGWTLLADTSGPARPRPGEALRVCRRGRAVAFRGAGGWEAWLADRTPARRAVAEDCDKPSAVFTPDGRSLIVDGRWDGLFRLDLEADRLVFMAQGNLGSSTRVPFSAGFRGDPVLLLAPGWGLDGHLQILQSHLAGQGREGLTTGAIHHYAPVLASGGRHLVYRIASFDEDVAGPDEERLFLFDFLDGRSVFEVDRPAQGLDGGPIFVGDRATMLYLADGHLWRVDPPPDR